MTVSSYVSEDVDVHASTGNQWRGEPHVPELRRRILEHADVDHDQRDYQGFRKDELVAIGVAVGEASDTTAVTDPSTLEGLRLFELRSTIAAAAGFDYFDVVDERDGHRIVDRRRSDGFTKPELAAILARLDDDFDVSDLSNDK